MSENENMHIVVVAGLVASKSLYMAAELGYVKSKEAAFDGTSQTFEDLLIGMANQMTYTAMAGKGDAERQASAAILTTIEKSETMTVE